MDKIRINRENPRHPVLETIMRFTPASIALAVALAVSSSGGLTQKPDSQIDPVSLEWLRHGEAEQRAGNLGAATDAFETALAVDPRNRAAYVAAAQIARAQGLQGKAIGLYREALLLDPQDIEAITGQGQAMAEKGALAKAKENLARVKELCKGECPQVARLDAAIAKGAPPPTVLSAKDVTPEPNAKPTEKQ
jgi:tetratricopeptide (TPR) repeat protein